MDCSSRSKVSLYGHNGIMEFFADITERRTQRDLSTCCFQFGYINVLIVFSISVRSLTFIIFEIKKHKFESKYDTIRSNRSILHMLTFHCSSEFLSAFSKYFRFHGSSVLNISVSLNTVGSCNKVLMRSIVGISLG